MLAAVVFVPSAPLLVPELAGPAASDTEPVRRAALDSVAGALGIVVLARGIRSRADAPHVPVHAEPED